ncbi:MAG TPA: acyl-CoA dehydrogenase family protein [Anaerolineales bacterium]|nr:acyl-CoA dehydrogenase family protein [Anaerolineales bacterium]
MIEFETPPTITKQMTMLGAVAEEMIRPVSRYFDDHEHEIPWTYINFMHEAMRATGAGSMAPDGGKKREGAPLGYQRLAFQIEMLSWGDAGLYLCTPGGGLGAAAVEATGTAQQKERFLTRFAGEKPVLACMAMTEPHCGSDTAAIRTRAVRDGDSWILNGEKIFVTAGNKSLIDTPGFVVVWATIDPAAGRAGMRPFVVEANTPGCRVTKLEHKLGIRSSDTASIVLENCRLPFENLLGSPEIETKPEGFRGAMATFDATRPLVSASALGVARAALELVHEHLAQQGIPVRYGLPRSRQTNLEREVIDMEAMHRSAWLMVLKAVWMADERRPNTLEASMSKVRAGDVATRITQRAVELLGPVGYSRKLLLEKWMRDAKINDIFEGTGQINRLVVARRILDYSSKELR